MSRKRLATALGEMAGEVALYLCFLAAYLWLTELLR
jgi:hypothetical protein